MSWKAHIDGGSRGNPGPAAAGVVLRDQSGQIVLAAGFFIGRATNNQAEYNGLLRAIELLEKARAKEVDIISDSELMVRQINGQYKVRSPDLRPLFEDARAGLEAFKWRIQHVLRERNTDADGLANDAMDAADDVVRVDKLGLLGKATRAAPASPAKPSSSPPAKLTIRAALTHPPGPGQCPARLRASQSFQFDEVTPPGLCLHLCAAALPAVLRMLQDPTLTANEVRCSKSRCGAVLQMKAEPNP